jgi:hypothetical protein
MPAQTSPQMERSPSAFAELEERHIRFHFLIQLNGQYAGEALGGRSIRTFPILEPTADKFAAAIAGHATEVRDRSDCAGEGQARYGLTHWQRK